VDQIEYQYTIEMNMSEDATDEELQYIVPFLPELLADMNRIMSLNED